MLWFSSTFGAPSGYDGFQSSIRLIPEDAVNIERRRYIALAKNLCSGVNPCMFFNHFKSLLTYHGVAQCMMRIETWGGHNDYDLFKFNCQHFATRLVHFFPPSVAEAKNSYKYLLLDTGRFRDPPHCLGNGKDGSSECYSSIHSVLRPDTLVTLSKYLIWHWRLIVSRCTAYVHSGSA